MHNLAKAHLEINQIEKRLVLIILVIVFTHEIKIKKYISYTCNSQSDTSMYFHNVVGTGSYWKLHNEYNQHVS
jgi:hypothetical protein